MGPETQNGVDRTIPWWAMPAAMVLFALLALVPLEGVVLAPLGLTLVFGSLAFVLVVFVMDLLKNRHLPRWSLPYAGLFLSVFGFSILSLTGRQMAPLRSWVVSVGGGLARFVWQAITSGLFWLSMLAVLGAGVFALALLPPLRPAFARIRRDWTRLSFLLYGAVVSVYVVDLTNTEITVGLCLPGRSRWQWVFGCT